MKKILVLPVAVIILLLSSCQKMLDYYIGIPEQPDFKQSNFHKGLNIMGILRPDSNGSYNMSFVYVQKVIPAVSNYFQELKITDATVKVFALSSNFIPDSVIFSYDNPSMEFSDSMYRPLTAFRPHAGETYGVVCRASGLPDAKGNTRMPDAPTVDQSSIATTSSSIAFNVVPDTTIKMLDMYLITPVNSYFIQRIVPPDSIPTRITVETDTISPGSILRIFSYDANLAAYYANTNTSLNFNKFRTTYSTLTSGYGVFGSLNYSDVKLP